MNVSRLTARKPVHDLMREQSESLTLHRALKPLHLVGFGIGAIIGAGIFVITGTAAAQYAGPGIMLFVLSAVACAFVGLCYAEFVTLIPVSPGSSAGI